MRIPTSIHSYPRVNGAHREITVIELQSLVVFGCTALFSWQGQLPVHMIEKRGGIISYLCIQNRAINRIRTYNHAAWASNSGEEKDSLDHSATGHFIYLKEQQTTVQATIQESHENLCGDLNLQPSHLQSAMLTTQLHRLVIPCT